MPICPGTVSRHDISKSTANLVEHHENEIVNFLNKLRDWVCRMLIVELIRVNLLKHITANRRVVRVANDFAAKE